MKIEKVEEIPKRPPGKYELLLNDFLESGWQFAKLTEWEGTGTIAGLRFYIEQSGLPVKIHGRGSNGVYLERIADGY